MDDDLFNILKKVAQNQGPPYKSIKLIDDTLIVVLNDGQIVTKYNATEEDYYIVLEAKTKIEIKNKIAEENKEEFSDVVEMGNQWSPLPRPAFINKTIKNRINKIN
jgi:predicted house-cleaning noncanonical NTP pyrophosphatase (MazG superfamily)